MFKKFFKEPIVKVQTMAYSFCLFYLIFLIKVGRKRTIYKE